MGPTRRSLAAVVTVCTVGVVVGALVLVSGCAREEAAETPASTSAPAAAPAPAPPDPQRTLAMMPIEGDTPIVREVRRLQEAARKAPGEAEVLVALGQAWAKHARATHDAGFYLNVEACAALALRAVPGDPEAMNLRGLALLDAHRFEEAAALARELTARRPGDAMAHGTLSDALLELGDHAGATAAAQKMLDIKPNLPSYSRASWLRWLVGDVEGALKLARSAVDAGRSLSDPEPRAWTLVQAATTFWHRGDLDGAAAGAKMALEVVADYPQARVLLGRIALARGDAAAAVTELKTAWAKYALVETGALLAEALAAAGDSKAAKAAVKAAVALGERTDALGLATMLVARGERLPDALRLIETERETRGGVYLDDAYAWALHRAGRSAEALPHARQAMQLGTPDASLMFHAGAIEVAAGDAAKGRELLARALETHPQFHPREAAEARALLQELGTAQTAQRETNEQDAVR